MLNITRRCFVHAFLAMLVSGVPLGAIEPVKVRQPRSTEHSVDRGVAAANCQPDEFTLCLTEERFEVRADFLTSDGQSGNARAVQLTGDTGYFWFFDETNVEIIVKTLDACFAGAYWVFAGGLTNVQVEMFVRDTMANEEKAYVNPLGEAFEPIQDTSTFLACP